MKTKIINVVSDDANDADEPQYVTLEEYNRTHSRVPWWKTLETQMLSNSRRDATCGERSAFEQRLWDQARGIK